MVHNYRIVNLAFRPFFNPCHGCVKNRISLVSDLMRQQSRHFSDRLSSLIWRLLARYGKIKYRYLLPVYRLLHLLPGESKAQGTRKPSPTLRYVQALMRVLKRSDLDGDRAQLKVIIERVQNSQGAIIFLPSVGWDIVNTQ